MEEETEIVAVVEMAKKRCKNVIDRINSIPHSKITDSCKRTLLRLANSELHFLCRSSLSIASTPLSVNIGHLEAIIHIIEQPFITGVSCVCKPISTSATKNANKTDSSSNGAYIDLVCTLNGNPVWFIVSDRNPKYVSWQESGKNKGLKARMDHILYTAHTVPMLKPSSIILFFSNGFDVNVCEKLKEEFGASEFEDEFSILDFGFFDEIEGDWLNILARSYRKACVLEIKVDHFRHEISREENEEVKGLLIKEDVFEMSEEHMKMNLGDAFGSTISKMKSWSLNVNDFLSSSKSEALLNKDNLINFDTTSLIAFVSGISNGGTKKLLETPETELKHRFKGNIEFVIAQVMSEIESPILVDLGDFINGKKGIICESVVAEFKELVSLCGGPNEKMRAEQLLKCLMVVADKPSERMMELPTTRKLAMKNKIVFGTGDYWRAPTLTANMAFVRAVSQTGMSLFTLEHRPRALTGD